jgi:hypothetical protein
MNEDQEASSGWWMILTNAVSGLISGVIPAELVQLFNLKVGGPTAEFEMWFGGPLFGLLAGSVVGIIVVIVRLPRRYRDSLKRFLVATLPGLLVGPVPISLLYFR